jgi:hypothetical protein
MARNVARQSVAHAKLSNDNDAIAMSESGHDRLIKTTLAVVEQCAMFSGPVLGLLDPTAAGRDVPSVDNRDGSTFYPHDGGMHSIDFHVRLLGEEAGSTDGNLGRHSLYAQQAFGERDQSREYMTKVTTNFNVNSMQPFVVPRLDRRSKRERRV